MKDIIIKFLRLNLGFLLCASSTVFMLNSNTGLAPWDVFHQGLAKTIGITMGQASVTTILVVVLIAIMLGQKVGIGTILNMILIGSYIDIVNNTGLIPVADNMFMSIIMVIIGMIIIGFGCYFYISCGLGCGPRDGVMLSLSQRFNKPIKVIRGCIEIVALTIGIILGGKVGVGTIVSAIAIGYSIQIVFKINKFDGVNLEHKSIFDTFTVFKNKIA